MALIIKAEPRACIIKYFRAASEEYMLVLGEMSGKNDSKFSSKPIQATNHEDEETATVVPKISVIKNKVLLKVTIINKKRTISLTGYEPISLNLAYLFDIF